VLASYYYTKLIHTVVPDSGLGGTPDVTAAATRPSGHDSPTLTAAITINPFTTVPSGRIAVIPGLRPANLRQNTVPVGNLSVVAWSVTSKIVTAGQAAGIGVGKLVIVQVRCCPAAIVPLQSLLNEVVKPAGPVSVTLNAPAPNETSVPAVEPAKLGGFGLLAVTCIVKLDGVAVVSPETIFITVNVAVVGVGVGVGVVLLAVV
jgi:hypothetical protein